MIMIKTVLVCVFLLVQYIGSAQASPDVYIGDTSNLYYHDPTVVHSGREYPPSLVPLPGGVESGRSVKVTATGSFYLHNNVSPYPSPVLVGPNGVLPDYLGHPLGALIGQWSTSESILSPSTAVGDPILVGTESVIAAPDTIGGPFYLFLGTNDISFFGDGHGYFLGYVSRFSRQLTSGSSHTCYLDLDIVTCWGNNAYDQSDVPAGLSNPSSLALGGNHSCVLDDNGVNCWGRNNYAQSTVPSTLSNPVAIAAGLNHTCALDDNGVQCWGAYAGGASVVPTLSNPIALSAFANQTCAIDDNGPVCWGVTYGTVPSNLSNPVMVDAGEQHACVLDDNGIHCWGKNTYGEASVPGTLSNPTSVSVGTYRSCALDDNGVKCWGAGVFGSVTPPSLSNPSMVSSGNYHSCALDDDGISCWGNNGAGQLNVPSSLRY